MDITTVTLPTCKSCGKTFGIDCERSNANRDYCKQCSKTVSSEITVAKRDNEGWLERAIEEGIPLWEQQPGESNAEYELWCSYQSLWPEVRPTVTRVSQLTGTNTSIVQRAYNKWTWGARMQAWIREVSAERTSQLRESRRRMVDEHIAMGESMRAKAMDAIEAFDPYDVTPNELVSILKETQRLEATARDMLDDIERSVQADVDSYEPINAPAGLFEEPGDPAALPGGRRGLDTAGMLEVVDILKNAGVLEVNQTVRVTPKEAPVDVTAYEVRDGYDL